VAGRGRTVGAATGRADAANRLVDGFVQDAQKTGAQNDATHFQASVVRLTENTMRVYGVDDFPGSVLRRRWRGSSCGATVQRQALRRDRHHDQDLENSPDFSAADGDIVYVSFESAAANSARPRCSTATHGASCRPPGTTGCSR